MLQGVGGEGMAEVVEADVFASCPFQHLGQLLSYRCRVQGGVLLFGGWEHPAGVAALPIPEQDVENGAGENQASAGGFGLGLGDHQLLVDALHLPLYL